jgi:hypothetical protein
MNDINHTLNKLLEEINMEEKRIVIKGPGDKINKNK